MTSGFQVLAQLSAERMLNCVLEGILLTACAWLLLRVFPWQNSDTRFAVWFAALLTVGALPLLGSLSASGMRASVDANSGLVLPSAWAIYLFLAWAAVA